MKTHKLKALALVATAVWTGESAWAAIETVPLAFDGTSIDSFEQFDPSQGSLTGVNIVFSVNDTAQALVYSLNADPTLYSDASVQNGSETVSAFGFSLSTSTLQAGPYSGTANAGVTLAGTGSAQNLTQTFSVSDFSSFIGTGLGSVTISVNPGTGYYSGIGQGDVFFGGTFSSYGTIDVDYSYIPTVVVPEARPFPLFTAGVAGLVGLGSLVYRVRRPTV